MTERERWTVYPLLFLALGLALKDKLVPPGEESVRYKVVVCNELIVDDPETKTRVTIVKGNLAASGGILCNELAVDDPKTKARVAVTHGNVAASGSVQCQNIISGALVVPGADGKVLATIAANEAGGFVRTIGSKNGLTTLLGNADQVAGLMFIDPQGTVHPRQLFAAPQQPGGEKPEEKPAEKDAPADQPKTEPPADQPSADETPAEKPNEGESNDENNAAKTDDPGSSQAPRDES